MKITKLKGTLDYVDNEVLKYRHIENKCTKIAQKYGFSEIITPIIEATECFTRSVGDSSDIVQKEMYTFTDRGDRSLTLRPEATAAVMRHFIENKEYVKPGIKKYYYFGPMFRYERPQAGRYRQFTQLGIECYGPQNPLMDADIINMACKMLNALGLKNLKVCINTIGGKNSRIEYSKVLKKYFSEHLDSLCQDCQNRFEKNPLRMLDCKVDGSSPIIKNAPKIADYLEPEDKEYFDKLLNSLKNLNISYEISERMVRGLDYYTNDVFEIIYQNPESALNGLAVCAGGRYNDMGKEFDGPDVEAIGFAMGVERLMAIMDELGINDYCEAERIVAVLSIGETTKIPALKLCNFLRDKGIKAEMDYSAVNLKPQFKMADRLEATDIIIIGDDEIANNEIVVKNTITKEEKRIKCTEINEYFEIKEEEKYAY